MAVRHDVYEPTDKNQIDPKKANVAAEKNDAEFWENKAKGERAKREYEEEQRQARLARERENAPSEAPFTVKGQVNLGNFDLQAQQEELKNTISQIQQDAQNRITALQKETTDYRERVHEIQLNMVENTLKAQIEALQRSVQEGQGKTPDFQTQLNQIEKFADILGYKRSTEEGGLPAEVKLKMLEMELQEKARAREFEQQKIADERMWQLKLKELEQQAAIEGRKIQEEQKKREMWISPFETLGSAIARGLIDSGGHVPEPTTLVQHKMKKAKSIILDAEDGESGVIDCPQCQEQIAIAPTARSAVCPSCETTFPINRKPKQ